MRIVRTLSEAESEEVQAGRRTGMQLRRWEPWGAGDLHPEHHLYK